MFLFYDMFTKIVLKEFTQKLSKKQLTKLLNLINNE